MDLSGEKGGVRRQISLGCFESFLTEFTGGGGLWGSIVNNRNDEQNRELLFSMVNYSKIIHGSGFDLEVPVNRVICVVRKSIES